MIRSHFVRRSVWAIALLAGISCLMAVIDNDIYRDGAWAKAQWLGQDTITLLVAVPALLLAQYRADKSTAWQIILAGILFYFVYTYAFFMFAAKFTFLFFFQLPVFSLSIFALISLLYHIWVSPFNFRLGHRGWQFAIMGYMSGISAMVAGLWLRDMIGFLYWEGFALDSPDGEPLTIVYALDLSLVIPLMAAGVGGMYRKKRLGYLLTGLMLTKTTTLGLSLMAMALSMYFHKLNPSLFLAGLWSVIGLIGLILTLFFFRYLLISPMQRQEAQKIDEEPQHLHHAHTPR